jgi:predicted kinase
MSVLRVLVGLPASGKSTFAKQLKEDEGYRVYSSDEYREHLGIDTPNNIVFDTITKDLKQGLSDGYNCIFDALNLGRKKRSATIKVLKDSMKRQGKDLKVYCDLFVVPVSTCIERNKARAEKHGVTDEVIIKKQAGFQCPWYTDGFNEIFVHPLNIDEMPYDRDVLDTFNQDNPHHSLSLGGHWKKAYKYIEQNYIFTENFPFLLEAIKYHDDGKILTKQFRDSRGNDTDIAHYYWHENVSSYLFLQWAYCLGIYENEGEYPLTDWGKLYVANLINWHMRPLSGQSIVIFLKKIKGFWVMK